MAPDVSCSSVKSIEPAEEALRGRSGGEGGERRSTPTGGGSVQRRTVELVGLSFERTGVLSKGVLWWSTLVARGITIHCVTHRPTIKS